MNRILILIFVMLTVLAVSACQPIDPASFPKEATVLPAEAPQAPEVAPEWVGTLEVEGVSLRILVSLAQTDGAWSGTIDIPQQGVTNLPLRDITIAPPAFHFEMLEGASAAVFDGALADDGSVSGAFTQAAYAGTFTMTPLAPKPVAEIPYTEEEVTVPSGEHTLAGTLTRPPGDGPFPALILVTGSGGQNRNEELPGILDYAPFAEIADRLTREGFIVLRYDDRGIGGSTGDFDTATTVDFADDAHAALAFLRARADVDATRTGILGHSEGGLIVGMVGASDPDLAFAVSVAGTGVLGYDLIIEQAVRITAASDMPAETVEKVRTQQTQVMDLVRAGDTVALEAYMRQIMEESYNEMPQEQRDALGPKEQVLNERLALQVAGLASPWYTFFLNYDPATDWSKVTAPTLLIFGELDMQVPPDQNRAPLEAALAGNPDVTVALMPSANHLFQKATTGTPSEYATLPGNLMPELLDTLAEWLTARAGIAQ